MNSESPQRLYARSLFEIAEESGSRGKTLEELQKLCSAFAEFPEYAALLDSPAVSVSQRQELADTVWRQVLSSDTAGFLKLIIKNRRAALLPQIMACYQDQYNQSENILDVTVASAALLEEPLKKRLREVLERKTGKRVTLHCRVEPAVIGGMLIEMEGSRIDATVRGELDKLKKALDKLPV